ncbi:MAG: uracil-DNA glycosylase [Gallionella sp.]
MDRREAILRELHLYPQWKLREQPAAGGGIAPAAKEGSGSPPAGLQVAVPAGTVLETPATAIVETPVATVAERPGPQAGGQSSASIAGVPGDDKLDWPELKQRVRECTACRLRAGCTQTVFGVGDEKAEWLFVGEGPGADEDAQGEPFVGQAGKLLDNMLMAINLKRGKNVYIANIVKCRPPGNRTPAADEIAQCMPYLQRQIELIQPRVIVALGKVASNALLGRDATLASLRGKVHSYQVTTASNGGLATIPMVVTYHPAYLLRSPTEKAKAWQDLLFAVRERSR